MQQNRADRVSDLLREEISQLIQRGLKDPRIGFVTITRVLLSRDLRHAKVFFSTYGDEEAKQKSLEGLRSALGFIRGELGRRLNLRYVPEIEFRMDGSVEYAFHIEEILHQMKREKERERMKELEEISESLRKAKQIAILSHENPEGDAIGSSLGAYFGLVAAGKEVSLFNPDPVPSYLAFLPGSEKIESTMPKDHSFDLYLVLDCGDSERVGGLREALRGPTINIDHHKGNGRFGDFNWVDEEASSTGEMIYRLLFEEMGLPLTREAAIALYTAILTDTGCFRFSNTTAESLQIAGSLLEMGIAPEKIASQLYEQRGLGQLHVLGELLSSLQVTENGKIAWGLITQEMLNRGQISLLETEGFVNYPRSVKGVEVAVIFKEAGFRRYRVSLRSKGGVDVGRVASAFSGGGHHNAAGCTVSGDLDEVRERVLEEIEQWMRA